MIYFVTENYLKTNTPITNNVDVTDVMPYVRTQAEMRLMPILGTYFYNDLLTKYNAGTLSADETTLVSYIQPVVAWRSAEDAVFGLSYQLKNKGLQIQSGEFSQPATKGDITFSMDHYGQKGKWFENRLTWWLLENKALFSAFTSADNNDSDIKPVDDCDDGLDNYDNTMIII